MKSFGENQQKITNSNCLFLCHAEMAFLPRFYQLKQGGAADIQRGGGA